MTECVACLNRAVRKRFRSLPVCKDCAPNRRNRKIELDRYEVILRQKALLKTQLSPEARLEVWPSKGLPYAVLGPPRMTGSWEAWDQEIARQKGLLEAGLLRRGWYRGGTGRSRQATLGWQQFVDGRFAWHGYDNHGIALYSGVWTGQVGGSWPSPDDYLQAWEAGQDAALKDTLDSFFGSDIDAILETH